MAADLRRLPRALHPRHHLPERSCLFPGPQNHHCAPCLALACEVPLRVCARLPPGLTGLCMQVTILTGSIVRVWGVLEQVLQRHEHELNKADRSMRIIRVEPTHTTPAAPDQAPLVGVRYKDSLLPEVCALCSFEC